MHIFTKLIFSLATFFILTGCSSVKKEDVLKEEFRKELTPEKNPILKKPAIEVIEVSAENFKVSNAVVPDKETINRIKILGAPLNDVIALITEATDQDIVFQLQSESQLNTALNGGGAAASAAGLSVTSAASTGGASGYGIGANDFSGAELTTSNVYVSASNIGFGRLLKKTVGDKLSIKYEDGTYYLGYIKTVTLKIPSITELAIQMQNTLQTLGALNVVHDSVTSTVTFSAREKEYQDIMKYLKILRNNLYVIEYDIAIYDVDLKDNYSLGINWNLVPETGEDLGFVSSATSSYGTVGATSTTATFGALFNMGVLSGSVIAEALTHFGKVESIQRPKLLGIAGTDVVLTDGLEEPYIAGITSIAVGEQGTKTTTENATALSGLKVTLNSNIMDGTVITDINLEVNDIIGYSDFNVGGVVFTQPKTHKKNIQNNIRVQPGIPIVISGLFRHKSDKGYKGLPGLATTSMKMLGGSEYEGIKKSEMVIIVTPRVIKYVMK